jgi:hypothetical protein
MNEINKTIAFVVVAAAVSLVAWLTYPSLPVTSPEDMQGKKLVDLKDPLAVASLEIVQYDEATATVRPFKVARVKDRWIIPSHDNYPADAKDQLAEAAAGMMDLKILETPATESGDHSTYGVIDPDPKTMPAGATGVGTRVVMRDANDKVLVALIVGKEVPGKSDLHYVRKVGQDQVYVVALKTAKLSGKFEDWIEKNLLKISSWDIKQVQVKDYSVAFGIDGTGRLDRRRDLDVDYNDTGDPKWKLVKDVGFDTEGRPHLQKLAADEELNTSKLDELRTALDDLKIVDVQPKPKGLSADLKGSRDFSKNAEARHSLSSRGFFMVPLENDEWELFSNQGEFHCVMKDGVEYVLRFGGVAGSDDSSSAKDDKKGKKDKKDETKTGLNRYLFVTAKFNPDVIPKPAYEPLPEEKKPEPAKAEPKKVEPTKVEPKKVEPAKAETKKPEAAPAKSAQPPAPKAEARPNGAKKPDAKKGGSDPQKSSRMFGAKVQFTADEKKAPEKKAPAKGVIQAELERVKQMNAKKQGEINASSKPAKAKEAGKAPPANPTKDAGNADSKPAKPDLKAERERIEKENKRKKDEYDEKIKKGNDRVKELNARFADWYYIISEGVYNKVHLGRSDIVKKKEKKDEKKDEHAGHDHATGSGVSPLDFEKLKQSIPGK